MYIIFATTSYNRLKWALLIPLGPACSRFTATARGRDVRVLTASWLRATSRGSLWYLSLSPSSSRLGLSVPGRRCHQPRGWWRWVVPMRLPAYVLVEQKRRQGGGHTSLRSSPASVSTARRDTRAPSATGSTHQHPLKASIVHSACRGGAGRMTGYVVDSGWASDTCDKAPGEDARSSTRNLQACVSGE